VRSDRSASFVRSEEDTGTEKTSAIAESSRGAGHEVRTRAENEHESPEIQPDRVPSEGERIDPFVTVRDRPQQLTDTELERAIVQAVTMGLGDVARTLAARLEERRRVTLPANVVPMIAKKQA
jgi:hypothetical protein